MPAKIILNKVSLHMIKFREFITNGVKTSALI